MKITILHHYHQYFIHSTSTSSTILPKVDDFIEIGGTEYQIAHVTYVAEDEDELSLKIFVVNT